MMNLRLRHIGFQGAWLIAGLLLVGCGSPPATYERWQADVRDHVAVVGHGDVNILRQASPVQGRPRLASLGGKDPQRTTDIVGLLLGQAQLKDRPAMVFLLARVERRVPTQLRVALVYDDGGDDLRPTVKLGPMDAQASQKYAKATNTSQTVDNLWPAPSDVFELKAESGRITVTEKNSGAAWSMELP